MTNITKCFVEKMKLPPFGMKCKNYYDKHMKGFGIRVTDNGVKSFFIAKYANNKVYRTTLGQHPALTTDKARRKAQDFLGKIAMGINPQEEKITNKMQTITLQTAFGDFLAARKGLKLSTINCYTRIVNVDFADWQTKPIININKQMISKRHAGISPNMALRLSKLLPNTNMAFWLDLQRDYDIVNTTKKSAKIKIKPLRAA